MEVEVCDICSKPFKLQVKKKPPPTSGREMSFQEFENAKRLLNKLSEEYLRSVVCIPRPEAKLKKLKAEIKDIKAGLKANINLALNFNHDFHKRLQSPRKLKK
jgi:hypothetical protein